MLILNQALLKIAYMTIIELLTKRDFLTNSYSIIKCYNIPYACHIIIKRLNQMSCKICILIT